MLAFARYVPVNVSRVVLADFNNDAIGAALATLNAYWINYLSALQSVDMEVPTPLDTYRRSFGYQCQHARCLPSTFLTMVNLVLYGSCVRLWTMHGNT